MSHQLNKLLLSNNCVLFVNHDIPVKDIRIMFDASHSFFDLPDNTKENYPMDYPRNGGWEKLPQVHNRE